MPLGDLRAQRKAPTAFRPSRRCDTWIHRSDRSHTAYSIAVRFNLTRRAAFCARKLDEGGSEVSDLDHNSHWTKVFKRRGFRESTCPSSFAVLPPPACSLPAAAPILTAYHVPLASCPKHLHSLWTFGKPTTGRGTSRVPSPLSRKLSWPRSTAIVPTASSARTIQNTVLHRNAVARATNTISFPSSTLLLSTATARLVRTAWEDRAVVRKLR
uniref:Uncharacterized protein n=1 Tax=Mycena chlorophos TaxID=658473 RepID=A0ABQ0L1R1_MYCCL|nr:predicted protein [Mycena chlorophos]